MKPAIFAMMLAATMLAGCSQAPQGAPKATENATQAGASATDPPANLNESQQAYAAVNSEMHKGMAAIDADPDVAFMEGMIAHHKGAVAMSEVALKYGKDAKVRDLATRIIKAQAGEIVEMEAWLKEKGKDTGAAPTASTAQSSGEHDAHAGH